MDEIADLITAPFCDVVEKSKTALNNAGDFQQMLKAARSLLKEGERALKRIEPLCKRRFDEHGSRFITALKENDELARYRKRLNDLLWEFDDYIDADDFDADKFAELQALSRDIAPRIYDSLLTIKMEGITSHFSSRSGASAFISDPSPPLSPDTIAAPKFPNVPPIPVRNTTRMIRDSSSSGTDTGSLGGLRTVNEELDYLVIGAGRAMAPPGSSRSSSSSKHNNSSSRSSSSSKHNNSSSINSISSSSNYSNHNSWFARGGSIKSQLPPEAKEEPPRPPLTNPWDVNSAPVPGDGQFQLHEETTVVRRPLVEIPVQRRLVDSPPASPPSAPAPPQFDTSPLRLHSQDDPHRLNAPFSYQGYDGGEIFRYFDNETETSDSNDPNRPPRRPRKPKTNRTTYTVFPGTKRMVVTEQAADRLSVVSTVPYSVASPHVRAQNRAPSVVESLVDPNLPPVRELLVDHGFTTPALVASRPQSQAGLIAAADADQISLAPMNPASTLDTLADDCIIDETSSFHIHKGFCAGALEVLAGGIGIKKAKKAGSLSSTLIVARCKSCTYEFDFKQLELDIRKLDEGNFVKNGIGHRLRFLQKSHLPTKKVDDILYGCVFCHRLGRTLDVSDATVFNTTAALFKHLARHPRPLPEIPGICVVDQEEIPPHLRNDFDLHFRHPPEPHPVHELATQIANLPTGVAKEALRKHNARSLPPDAGPVLDVMEGGKIVGITWPNRYQGEWCMGWHDGVHGALPSEIVKLDRPDSRISLHTQDPMSRTQARARLKFAPKEKEWLRFDRGELIRNISYAGSHNNHWCWAGTNAKGKSGIFPQAFMDFDTIHEVGQPHHDHGEYEAPHSRKSERESISGDGGDELVRSSSLLSQLSARNRSKRSSSIAHSASSAESARRKFGSFMVRGVL